jgi:hypothetical protein
MTESPLDEMPPLERAAHLLREAQTLNNLEEFNVIKKDTEYSFVEEALNDIEEYQKKEEQILRDQMNTDE